MSVVSYGREAGYPKSTYTFQNRRVVPTHTDRLRIIVDSDSDIGPTILPQLPYQIGVFLVGSTARLTTISFSRSDGARLLWFADLTYTEIDDEEAEDQDKPPDQRRPEWAWDFETLPRTMTVDAIGNAIQTSAGDPIEHESLIPIPVLTIERYQLVFDPSTIVNYFNRTNDSSFWGAPVDTALMAGIRDRKDSVEVWEGVAYRKVSYVVKFALPFILDVLEGWDDMLVDHGWHKLDGGVKKPIFEGATRVSRNLDGNGAVLAPGADPHVLKFTTHEAANFDALGINWGQF